MEDEEWDLVQKRLKIEEATGEYPNIKDITEDHWLYGKRLDLAQTGIRQKTLKKFLKLFIRLEWNYSQQGEIYQNWIDRKENHITTSKGNFYIGVNDEEIQEILDCSLRTAKDYNKLITWFAIWFM